MNESTPKQQIVDRIKNVTNILVTVSTNPTVDELSAAIGLTLMLNKLDKHATAVFSGKVPQAINFLDPEKTLENTVDSLRDFIIALDKEKADRLRYRVEDDMVRIFITPYRTKISQNDLEFSHGDFNVELVIALGVENKEMLDGAIAAHGKILHGATVATFSAQDKKSDLGSIDWQDPNASSLCEMLVSVSESLKQEESLLDEQIATSLLTGIVSATDRFSNKQTSPKSMTMAAQLMAAGANQQLIAAKLEETAEISPLEPDTNAAQDLTQEVSQKIEDLAPLETQADEVKKSDDLGEMTISHSDDSLNPEESIPELASEDSAVVQPEAVAEEPAEPVYAPSATVEEHDKRNKRVAGEEALDEALSKLSETTAIESPLNSLLEDLQNETVETQETPEAPVQAEPVVAPIEPEMELIEEPIPAPSEKSRRRLDSGTLEEPSMGGAFSATAEDAAEARRKEEESSRNRVIMSHDGPAASIKAATVQPPTETLADIEAQLQNQPIPNSPLPEVDNARQELDSLFDNGSAPVVPDVPIAVAPVQAAPMSTPLNLPPPPPLPDFSTLPPLPGVSEQTFSPNDALPAQFATPPAPVAASGPGQFRIPGQ